MGSFIQRQKELYKKRKFGGAGVLHKPWKQLNPLQKAIRLGLMTTTVGLGGVIAGRAGHAAIKGIKKVVKARRERRANKALGRPI